MSGNKIRISFMLLFAFVLIPSMFARAGIGIQGGASLTPKVDDYHDFSAGITLRSDYTPWGIAANWNFREKSVSLVLDNWWVYKDMDSCINWFAFWGMSFGGKFENRYFADTGARVGAGMNAFLFDSRCLEVYAHAAWNPSIGAGYSRDSKKYFLRFVPACFPVNAGLRVWM